MTPDPVSIVQARSRDGFEALLTKPGTGFGSSQREKKKSLG